MEKKKKKKEKLGLTCLVSGFLGSSKLSLECCTSTWCPCSVVDPAWQWAQGLRTRFPPFLLFFLSPPSSLSLSLSFLPGLQGSRRSLKHLDPFWDDLTRRDTINAKPYFATDAPTRPVPWVFPFLRAFNYPPEEETGARPLPPSPLMSSFSIPIVACAQLQPQTNSDIREISNFSFPWLINPSGGGGILDFRLLLLLGRGDRFGSRRENFSSSARFPLLWWIIIEARSERGRGTWEGIRDEWKCLVIAGLIQLETWRYENLERKLWKTVNGITEDRDNWWVTEFWNVVVREECEEIDLRKVVLR